MLAGSPGADGAPPRPLLTLAVRDAAGRVQDHSVARAVR
jgi:hypothetical protein